MPKIFGSRAKEDVVVPEVGTPIVEGVDGFTEEEYAVFDHVSLVRGLDMLAMDGDGGCVAVAQVELELVSQDRGSLKWPQWDAAG